MFERSASFPRNKRLVMVHFCARQQSNRKGIIQLLRSLERNCRFPRSGKSFSTVCTERKLELHGAKTVHFRESKPQISVLCELSPSKVYSFSDFWLSFFLERVILVEKWTNCVQLRHKKIFELSVLFVKKYPQTARQFGMKNHRNKPSFWYELSPKWGSFFMENSRTVFSFFGESLQTGCPSDGKLFPPKTGICSDPKCYLHSDSQTISINILLAAIHKERIAEAHSNRKFMT